MNSARRNWRLPLIFVVGFVCGGVVIAGVFILMRVDFAPPSDAELKAQLIERISSQTTGEAVLAVETLRTNGWLQDGSLRGKSLNDVALAHTDLSEADLMCADLSKANLQDVHLSGANLENANLEGANLEAADLRNAGLKGANLVMARINDLTILPDGTNWRETDISRFTDPKHRDFWQPE